ncbi:hypothetical protein OY671_010318, partial [Metschnikowia pulcherrima]
MSAAIPVYQLNALTEAAEQPAAVFFSGPDSAPARSPINSPYRSNYYKIGLGSRGHAASKVNLETYDIGPGSSMVLSPYVVKQWPATGPDFESSSIFFTP